jgi:hypothetical protein
MCRWMAYFGDPVSVEDLLFRPEHSIIDQSLHAKLGGFTTNGDGFGIGGTAPARRLPCSRAPIPLGARRICARSPHRLALRCRFAGLGFDDVRLAETADGSNAVIGSRACANADAPTVLLYAHYDVRPPLGEEAWHTPPFFRARSSVCRTRSPSGRSSPSRRAQHPPRSGDRPDRGGGAADPDPRAQRERRPRGDRGHGSHRGTVPTDLLGGVRLSLRPPDRGEATAWRTWHIR